MSRCDAAVQTRSTGPTAAEVTTVNGFLHVAEAMRRAVIDGRDDDVAFLRELRCAQTATVARAEAVCGLLEEREERTRAVVMMDEDDAFDTEILASAGLELLHARGRSH
jgi:hypothetical protein